MSQLEQDALNRILVHVGETRKGIENLEADVQQINKQLRDLSGASVRRQECQAHRDTVTRSVTGLQRALSEIKQDIKHVRGKTDQAHPVITAQMLAQNRAGSGSPHSSNKESRGLKYWLALSLGIGSLVTLLGGGAMGLMRLGRSWERMDQTIEAFQKQQAKANAEFRKFAAQPKVVHIRTVAPDAGPSRRRARRRQPRRRADP